MNVAETKTVTNVHEELPLKHWKARMVVSSILLFLSLVGVVISCLVRETSFSRWYWTGAVIIFAVISLWLSRKDGPKPKRVTGLAIWHGALHWLALLVIIFHIHLLVYSGITDNITAVLVILLLLALTTFLAGLYYDSLFTLIGIILFILAIFTTLLYQYVLLVVIIAVIVIAAVIYWLYRRKTSKIPLNVEDN